MWSTINGLGVEAVTKLPCVVFILYFINIAVPIYSVAFFRNKRFAYTIRRFQKILLYYMITSIIQVCICEIAYWSINRGRDYGLKIEIYAMQ